MDSVDRSADLSQPLDRLGPDETLKYNSDQLRGTIALSLLDRITGSVSPDDTKLMKFQGIYQQDDRDARPDCGGDGQRRGIGGGAGRRQIIVE